MIVHKPITNIDKVIAYMAERDGVPIKYVCTTEIRGNNKPCDVYYRDTPHPKFGNSYFALTYYGDSVIIMDADVVETYEFVCVMYNEQYHYSSYRHDFVEVGGSAIDGGRAYTRMLGNGPFSRFRIKDGECIVEEMK